MKPCIFCGGHDGKHDWSHLHPRTMSPLVAEAIPAQTVNYGELSAQYSWNGQLNDIEAGYSITASIDPHPDIIFHPMAAETEVLRLTKDGFIYKGNIIEDAGEAHAAMLKALGCATSSINSFDCIPAQTGIVARIDTDVKFLQLLSAYRMESNLAASQIKIDFIAHINAAMTAYGHQQREEGRREVAELKETLTDVENEDYELLVKENIELSDRAEKAEANYQIVCEKNVLMREAVDRFDKEREGWQERAEKAEAELAKHIEIERLHMELERQLAARRARSFSEKI